MRQQVQLLSNSSNSFCVVAVSDCVMQRCGCVGAVGFSFAYHATNSVGDEDALAVIRRAEELGQSFLDTSDVYGPHTNEKLLCA